MHDFKGDVLEALGTAPQVLIKAEIVVPLSALDEPGFAEGVEAFQAHGSFDIVNVRAITSKHPKHISQEA